MYHLNFGTFLDHSCDPKLFLKSRLPTRFRSRDGYLPWTRTRPQEPLFIGTRVRLGSGPSGSGGRGRAPGTPRVEGAEISLAEAHPQLRAARAGADRDFFRCCFGCPQGVKVGWQLGSRLPYSAAPASCRSSSAAARHVPGLDRQEALPIVAAPKTLTSASITSSDSPSVHRQVEEGVERRFTHHVVCNRLLR